MYCKDLDVLKNNFKPFFIIFLYYYAVIIQIPDQNNCFYSVMLSLEVLFYAMLYTQAKKKNRIILFQKLGQSFRSLKFLHSGKTYSHLSFSLHS
jgi:hypothetical protein